MLADLIRPDVAELIRNRNFNQLREFLLEEPVPDLAEPSPRTRASGVSNRPRCVIGALR